MLLTGLIPRMLAAILVCIVGSWLCLLTYRRVHHHRWPQLATAWALKVLVVATMALAAVVVNKPDLLTMQPAAGLLFPLAAWFSVQTWRAMRHRDRPLAVRAAADIVLSLLLGADLVLALVWFANRLDLAEPEVAFLRDALERAGSIADLPWWLWLALYLLLAGASLAFAVWTTRLSAVTRWSDRLHVVSLVDMIKRVLTGVHIGLLATVLIGLAAPPALATTLRGQLQAKYTLALQHELKAAREAAGEQKAAREAAGEQAAYEEIRSQFSRFNSTSPVVRPLVPMVTEIHDISSRLPGSHSASIERDLADRIGQLQESTLKLPAPESTPPAKSTKFKAPIRDSGDLQGDLQHRLGQLATEQRQASLAERQANLAKRQAGRAADLTFNAVADTITTGISHFCPQLGEVVQIISTEYLSSDMDESRLKNAISAWVQHRIPTAPTSADQMVIQMVIPDPGKLREAAANQESNQESVASQPISWSAGSARGHAPTDPARSRAMRKSSPVAAAVDLVDETRYLEKGTDPCQGCTPVLRSRQVPDQFPWANINPYDWMQHPEGENHAFPRSEWRPPDLPPGR